MTREEAILYFQHLEEQARRIKANQDAYKPNRAQAEVHSSKKPIRAMFAANSVGKTTLGANEAVWFAKGYNPLSKEYYPVPADIIVVLDQPKKIYDKWIPELRKWHDLRECTMRKNGKPYVEEIVFPNGSRIVFMLHGSDPMLFESIEIDVVIYDEPCPKFIYTALTRGGRKKGRIARHLFICTPLAYPWMRQELWEPFIRGERDDLECFRFNVEVNLENLPEDYVKKMKATYSPEEQRTRLEGEFFDLSGFALAYLWNKDVHIIKKEDIPEIVLCTVAIDPHPNKNHVACVLGCDKDGNLYYLDEIESGKEDTPRDFARKLKKFYQPYTLFDIVCDSLGSTRLSGGEGNKSFIDILKDEGIQVRATTYEDKKDDSWIVRIQSALMIPEEANKFGLRLPRLRVAEHCKKIIMDIETVAWLKIKNENLYKPKLDIAQKDYLACLKYALASNLAPSRSKRPTRYVKKAPSSYGIEKW